MLWLKAGIVLIALLYASITDIKQRIISNKVTLLILVVGLLTLNIHQLVAINNILALLPSAIVMLIMFYRGHLGGGDFKLMMALYVCYPDWYILILISSMIVNLFVALVIYMYLVITHRAINNFTSPLAVSIFISTGFLTTTDLYTSFF